MYSKIHVPKNSKWLVIWNGGSTQPTTINPKQLAAANINYELANC